MQRLNRRQLTQTLLAGAATAVAAPGAGAQTSSPQPLADELLAAAKRQVENNRSTLDKFPLPMSTEPASAFKAV